MGFFTIGGRRRTLANDTATGAATPERNVGFPYGFDAVGEALLAEECPLAACDTVGREMALDGASAPEALSGLSTTWEMARACEPPFSAVHALVVAWSETTLSAVNQISCEDPMTGLSSAAHLRSVLFGTYRQHHLGAPHPRDSHALVVLDLSSSPEWDAADSITRALRTARLGDGARTVFAGHEVIAAVHPTRVVVLAARDARLGVRVRLLRRLADGMQLGPRPPRVWIEGLPANDVATGSLLDELARG